MLAMISSLPCFYSHMIGCSDYSGTWALPGASAPPAVVALAAVVSGCLPLIPAAAVACVAAGCGLSLCSGVAGCDY